MSARESVGGGRAASVAEQVAAHLRGFEGRDWSEWTPYVVAALAVDGTSDRWIDVEDIKDQVPLFGWFATKRISDGHLVVGAADVLSHLDCWRFLDAYEAAAGVEGERDE